MALNTARAAKTLCVACDGQLDITSIVLSMGDRRSASTCTGISKIHTKITSSRILAGAADKHFAISAIGHSTAALAACGLWRGIREVAVIKMVTKRAKFELVGGENHLKTFRIVKKASSHEQLIIK